MITNCSIPRSCQRGQPASPHGRLRWQLPPLLNRGLPSISRLLPSLPARQAVWPHHLSHGWRRAGGRHLWRWRIRSSPSLLLPGLGREHRPVGGEQDRVVAAEEKRTRSCDSRHVRLRHRRTRIIIINKISHRTTPRRQQQLGTRSNDSCFDERAVCCGDLRNELPCHPREGDPRV